MFKKLSVTDRKGTENKGKPDSPAYRYADSGCPEATEFLKSQSVCLVNCPFPECYMDGNKNYKDRA